MGEIIEMRQYLLSIRIGEIVGRLWLNDCHSLEIVSFLFSHRFDCRLQFQAMTIRRVTSTHRECLQWFAVITARRHENQQRMTNSEWQIGHRYNPTGICEWTLANTLNMSQSSHMRNWLVSLKNHLMHFKFHFYQFVCISFLWNVENDKCAT